MKGPLLLSNMLGPLPETRIQQLHLVTLTYPESTILGIKRTGYTNRASLITMTRFKYVLSFGATDFQRSNVLILDNGIEDITASFPVLNLHTEVIF